MKSKESPETNTNVGAKKLLGYSAKHHGKEYVNIGNESGLAISGKMNDIQLAALMHDTGMKDWQGICILKHLRVNLNAAISCSFMETKKLKEGYVEPRWKNSASV